MTVRSSSLQRRGFDLLQAINSPEELTRGAVYELPLSHKTLDIVRYDHYALLLLSNGTIVVLDLRRPERPMGRCGRSGAGGAPRGEHPGW